MEKRRRPIVVLAVAALLATCVGAGGVLLADRLMNGSGGLDGDSSRRAAELTVATSGVATEVGLLLRQLEAGGAGGSAPREALDRLARQGSKAQNLARQVDSDLPEGSAERETLAKANRDLDRAAREVVGSVGDEGRAEGIPSPVRVRVALAEVGRVGRTVGTLARRLDLKTNPTLKDRLATAVGKIPREDVDIRLEANVALAGASDDSLAGSGVAGLGDVDGDGQGDVAIAAQGEGTVYVVPGEGLASGTASGLGEAGFAISSLPVDTAEEAIDVDLPPIYDGTLEVAPAGDVNGDELADMLIGVADDNESTGVAYVIFGSEASTDVDVGSLGSRGYAIRGPGPYWRAGTSVRGVGDVNGDDRDDIAIGGRRQFDASGTTASTGASVTWVLLGGPSREDVALPKRGGPSDGFMIDGIGDSLARAGDVNGDGLEDIAGGDAFNRMGAPGSGGIVFGRREPPRTIQVDEPGDWGLALRVPQGRIMGSFVSGAGDQNGDGLADVAVGSHALQTDPDEFNDFPEPEVTVVYGRRSATAIDLSDPGSNGAKLEGFGPTVAAAGDVNGDSAGDLVAETSRQITDSGPPIGGARVFFGQSESAPGATERAGAQRGGFALEGAGVPRPTSDFTSEGRIGSILAGAGDVDDDGSDDLILGAPYDGVPTAEGGRARGTAFLVFAEPPEEETSPLAGTVSARGLGAVRIGGSASEAGDELGTEPEVGGLAPCGYLPTPDSRVAFLIDGDTLARVEVDGPGYATEKGVEVGDTEASVLAAYGARARRSQHQYVPEGSYLTVRTPTSSVPDAKIVFETDGDSVTLIRAGRSPEVDFVEGCA